MSILQMILVIVSGYLIGSLPSAYVITRFVSGINIFEVGSGNMGGTNVARTMGLHWVIFTAAIDVCKGIAAVWIAQQLVPDAWLTASILAGLAAVAGHNWSLFATALYSYYNNTFAIRGGKGAATAYGTMIMLLPFYLVVFLMVIGVIIAVTTRYASLSVLVSFSITLVASLVWSYNTGNFEIYLLYVILLSILIVWRFRENMQRLATGTERRLGERATEV